MGGIEGRDISGCATVELAAFFHHHKPSGMDSRSWVKKYIPDWAIAGDDGRDFAKIVDQCKYPFTGLKFVDRIVQALGFNLHTLTETGQLTIIPSGDKGAAQKMVKEEVAASLEGQFETEDELAELLAESVRRMGKDEFQARCDRLMNLRKERCAPTPEQLRIFERDTQRTNERRERVKQQERDIQAA